MEDSDLNDGDTLVLRRSGNDSPRSNWPESSFFDGTSRSSRDRVFPAIQHLKKFENDTFTYVGARSRGLTFAAMGNANAQHYGQRRTGFGLCLNYGTAYGTAYGYSQGRSNGGYGGAALWWLR